MAIETRTIFFDQDELIRAAHAFCLLQEKAVPRGRLTAVVAEPEAAGRVRLQFDGAGRRPVEIVLSYAEMAAGLIAYCATVAIPLPRYSRKRLMPAGEGMALVIRLPEFAGPADVAEAADRRALPAA